jgi:hypothetical protein
MLNSVALATALNDEDPGRSIEALAVNKAQNSVALRFRPVGSQLWK